MKRLFVVAAFLVFASCAQESDKPDTPASLTVGEQVENMIDQDNYTEALALLSEQPEGELKQTLLEKTYLNYGLFLEYRDSNVTNMRDKMNNALRQYIEVLKINPDNEKAITEIEQILGIYSTFPDRSPDEEVMEELKNLGF